MPFYAYILIIAATMIWFYPFVPAHQNTPAASVVDRRSRWGMLLQFIAYVLLWQGHFWMRPLLPGRVLVSVLLFALAIALSWKSSRDLAGQLRIDAALGADHHLVRSGVYGIMRNPIYTSMLLIDCATAVIVTPWQLFLPALILFIVGTEIRVHTEERLLAERFKNEFEEYKQTVSAYIPLVL